MHTHKRWITKHQTLVHSGLGEGFFLTFTSICVKCMGKSTTYSLKWIQIQMVVQYWFTMLPYHPLKNKSPNENPSYYPEIIHSFTILCCGLQLVTLRFPLLNKYPFKEIIRNPMFSLTKQTTPPHQPTGFERFRFLSKRHQGTHQGLHTIVACHAFHLGPNGGRMPGIHGRLMMDVRFVEASVIGDRLVGDQNPGEGGAEPVKKGPNIKWREKYTDFARNALQIRCKIVVLGKRNKLKLKLKCMFFEQNLCIEYCRFTETRYYFNLRAKHNHLHTHTLTQTMPYRCLDIRIIQTAAPYLICK